MSIHIEEGINHIGRAVIFERHRHVMPGVVADARYSIMISAVDLNPKSACDILTHPPLLSRDVLAPGHDSQIRVGYIGPDPGTTGSGIRARDALVVVCFHVMAARTIKLQSSNVIAFYPLRLSDQRPVMAMAGPIDDSPPNPLVKGPPEDQAGIIRQWHDGYRRETPGITFVRGETIELIDSPIVGFIHFKRAGIISYLCHWQTTRGVAHLVKIVAEIHVVQFGAEARSPG